MDWACEPSPLKEPMNSPDRPTEPTVMVGLPVSFFTQPAKLSAEPSNSGSQKRRCEAWKMSTPASARGCSQSSISRGVGANWKPYSRVFHCETRRISGRSGPMALRTAFTISTAKRLRSGRVGPPQRSLRWFVASQKNWSMR